MTTDKHKQLEKRLQNTNISHVMPQLEHPEKICRLDFSPHNTALMAIDMADTEIFSEYVEQMMANEDAEAGVGGYMEWREIYRRSRLFDGEGEDRCIHLGIDIWAPALSPVHTPLAGKIHSVKNNEGYGNYGGTVIVEHNLEGLTLYSLYGHLSKASAERWEEGQRLDSGDRIGELGIAEENGHWPAHLHFQLMFDMLDMKGDFPGVCTRTDQPKYQATCPNPNLLLRLSVLS